jgi:hypothetical protein
MGKYRLSIWLAAKEQLTMQINCKSKLGLMEHRSTRVCWL